jgi:hypothetical protein
VAWWLAVAEMQPRRRLAFWAALRLTAFANLTPTVENWRSLFGDQGCASGDLWEAFEADVRRHPECRGSGGPPTPPEGSRKIR